MAINQDPVALEICVRTVNAVSRMLDELDRLEALNEQMVSSGIDLANFSETIETSLAIGHCDAATYKAILSAFIPAIVVNMKATYDGTPTMQGWAALMKARR